ncbi:MAG: PTS sugar transporter subunit IIA [Treponema sp.]|jgi:mannitol/fructose-specific phosphotransferase system IIA component (Ntr-type)|nr:PTS sugar transporter subunit IIA [Treponema sp.]
MLSEIFDVQHIKLNLESETKDEVFEELVATITAQHPELNHQDLLEAITTRESQMNTAVAPGIAIPHGYCHTLNGIVGVVGISRAGIEYDTEMKETVHYIFMVLMSCDHREKHLTFLSKLLKLLDPQMLSEIQEAKSAQDFHNILCRFEQGSIKEPA